MIHEYSWLAKIICLRFKWHWLLPKDDEKEIHRVCCLCGVIVFDDDQ
jgi:hypothetical protein